jgi:hypothetical protein
MIVSARGASEGNQMAEVAKPPQYCGREPSRQGAVPVSERGQPGVRVFAGEELVERNSPPQNTVENIGGNSSSGEAGNFRLRGSARTRHTPIVAAKLCPRREASAKNVSNAQL